MNGVKKIRKILILWLVNTILRGTHFFSIKRRMLNLCEGINIGEGTKIVAPIHIPCWSVLEVGTYCWLGRDFTLEGNGKVYIGDKCDLAPNVICVTGSHNIGSAEHRAGQGFNSFVNIGDGSWIGTRAILLPNTSVGRGCVVGAAAVVTKDVANNSVWVGNPGKKIRDL